MSDAMTGLATGNREGKPEEREQEILTPPRIIDFVRDVFGGRIALDPCAAVDDFGDPIGTVDAARWYDGTLAAALPQCQNGLTQQWVDRTFVNPPYADLHAWLDKAVAESDFAPGADFRISVLCQVRSNRWWWRSARNLAKQTGAVVELNPFPFVEFEKGTIRQSGKKKGQVRTSDEVAPMSMCLMFFNVRPDVVAKHLPNTLGEILK